MALRRQLGNISHGAARSFNLHGSVLGVPDGVSCTGSEDDQRTSKKQYTRLGFQPKQKSPAVAPEPVIKAVPARSKNGSVHRSHEGSRDASSAPCVPSTTPTSRSGPSTTNGKVNSVTDDGPSTTNGKLNSVTDDGRATQKGFVHPSKKAVGVLSGLMKYKIAMTEGQGVVTKHNCADRSELLPNMNYFEGKPHSRTRHSKLQPPYNYIAGNSFSNSAENDLGGDKAENAGSVGAKQSIPLTYGVAHRSSTNTQGQRQCVPQKASTPDNDSSETQSGIWGSNAAAASPENMRSAKKFQHPAKSVRSQARGASSTNRSSNNVRSVELYHHTLQQIKWDPTVEDTLDNLCCKLDAFQANQVLKLLRDHSMAFRFFKWLKRQAGFKHDEHTYTTMIGILGQAKQFDSMERLLKEMTSDGCQPTVVTFNRLIHAYGRANYISDAVKVFHKMQEDGYEPDRVTYCTLIDIHAKAGYLETALDLYQRMQEVGLSPDTFTYSAMVNCLGKGGYLAAADKLFSEMIEQGCVPNLVTYNIMIALQAKARNYPSAVKLYNDMQTAGFRPDKITYSIVMEVLGHCGNLDGVEAVFMEMKRDWVPDEPAYGLLVDLWGKAGDVDKARAWYQSMLDTGLRPNVPTCNSLLSAFLKAYRFADALDVLRNMLYLGLVPSLQTYTLLLSCCCEAHAQMGLCCELMAITGHPAHMFLLSLPKAEPGGQNVRDHASSFLDLMHSEDRESKRGLLDAVIDFMHKSGLKEEAAWIWEVAAQRNVYPDSVREKQSSYWLINLHVMSEGTAVTALSRTLAWFQRQIIDSGEGPRRIDIITGWGRRSRVTGSSLVRQSVQELLTLFRFPFAKHGNNGCFVGCGETLNRWLLNSYVERMHLL